MPPHRRPHPPSLPSHLSYKSALVLLPSASITPPIQSIRRKHDRNFRRWPPHINLIYPFLARPSAQLESNINPRLQEIAQSIPRFTIGLSKISHFRHGPKSATIFLDPGNTNLSSPQTASVRAVNTENDVTNESRTDAQDIAQIFPTHTGTDDSSIAMKSNLASDQPFQERGMIQSLQAALQAEFTECNADTRPFTPHLSLGQAKTELSMANLEQEAERVIRWFLNGRDMEAAPAQIGKAADEGNENITESLGENVEEPIENGPWELQLSVDRIVVIERTGYDDPFGVVAEVPLFSEDEPVEA